MPDLSAPAPMFAAPPTTDGRPDPSIKVAGPETYFDSTTVVALALSWLMIMAAIWLGNANARFFDIASVLLVILGTISVTATSYTTRELARAWPLMLGTWQRKIFNPEKLAQELLDIAVLARKRGILALSAHAREMEKNPFLSDATQMVTDGLAAPEIDRLIHQDIEVTLDGYRKAAGMMRRASEIAPAMGLVGTLIGLVQMLVALDNPATIGPAMALALLTTLYGAVMGSVVLAPLAAKIEHNAHDEVLVKTMIHAAMVSILAQENPRKLEMDLNTLLPPDRRVRYFEG